MKYAKFIPSEKCRQWEFLLSVTHSAVLPGFEKRIENQCLEDINWDFIIPKASRHGLVFPFFQFLKKNCPHVIPPPHFDRLLKTFRYNAERNLSLTAKLLSVLIHLQRHGIPAVSFKGPTLSEFLYGDLTLRSFADIDILVHPEDALKAVRLIEKQGYSASVLLNDPQLKAYMENEYSIELFAKHGEGPIELHWELEGRYTAHPLTLDLFQERLEQKVLTGKKVYQLPPEELLLYLCIHGSKDGWNSLESILSLAALIARRPDLDWGHVFHLAKIIRCQRMLLLGLFLAKDIFHSRLPGFICRKIETDCKIQQLAEKIFKYIFNRDSHRSNSFAQSDFSYFHLCIRDSFTEKVRHIIRLIFQPSRQEWRYFSLPSSLAFFHFILRPIRLMWNYGPSRF